MVQFDTMWNLVAAVKMFDAAFEQAKAMQAEAADARYFLFRPFHACRKGASVFVLGLVVALFMACEAWYR